MALAPKVNVRKAKQALPCSPVPNSRPSKASWILKGPIGASDFKAYIFPMLFFKRISDVYDEEYATALAESGGDEEYAQLPEFHRFVIPEGCHWNNVRETTTNVGLKIEQSLREIEQAF